MRQRRVSPVDAIWLNMDRAQNFMVIECITDFDLNCHIREVHLSGGKVALQDYVSQFLAIPLERDRESPRVSWRLGWTSSHPWGA